MRRRTLLQLAAACAALPALPRLARAQVYPARPIRLIVGFPAGGQIDIIARLTAQWLGQALKQNVVVENKPGAGGNLGAEAVVKAAPDGYTLFFAASSNTVNTTLFAHLSYDFARDTTAIGPINRIPLVLIANPSFEPKTVAALIAAAKQKPGALTMGSPSAGTPPYLAVALLKMMAGIELVQVPYFGESQMITDLLGGQLMVGIGGISSAIGHIKAGRLRALGVTTPGRIEQLPDVPAIAETLPGFASVTWYALVAPPKTPAAIIDKINAGVSEALRDPDVQKRLADLSAEPVGGTPQATAAYFHDEVERWKNVITSAHVTLE